MSGDFKGLTVVVTGAGSGIGLAVSTMLEDEGALVFGLDLNAGAMEPFATFIQCDIGSDEDVVAAFAAIAQQADAIDIVINNAGVGAVGSIATATTQEWNRVLNINVLGISRVTSAALPLLRKSKHASVVNVGSIAATAGLPDRAIYSASKGAVVSLTLAMSADFIGDNIRVNCVNPGTADTPWVERLLSQSSDPDAHRAALEARQPMGRLVSPEEVASAILYLAHPRQSSTTGTVLAVDGGMHGLRLPKR